MCPPAKIQLAIINSIPPDVIPPATHIYRLPRHGIAHLMEVRHGAPRGPPDSRMATTSRPSFEFIQIARWPPNLAECWNFRMCPRWLPLDQLARPKRVYMNAQPDSLNRTRASPDLGARPLRGSNLGGSRSPGEIGQRMYH